ncbi:MAG: hypothetical protein RLZZ479_148 [Bacteroidota bacterium]
MNALASAMRGVLLQAAKNINEKIFQLVQIDDEDERLEAITKMFGIDEQDRVKITKSNKTSSSASKKPATAKPKAEKKMPVPFWMYSDKKTKQVITTAKDDLCQGLTAGLYSQCTRKPKDGEIYCPICKKDADKNDGVPKRGNIQMRTEQFKEMTGEDKHLYSTPDGKVKKIYPLDWYIKNKYTKENFSDMLTENGINLTDKGLALIEYIPEKNVRPKKTNLTTDMKPAKKTKNTKLEDDIPKDDEDKDDEDKDEDFDDELSETASNYSQSTTDGNADDDDVPFPPDDDDDDAKSIVSEPEPEPEPEKSKKAKKPSAEVPDNCHTIITPKSSTKKTPTKPDTKPKKITFQEEAEEEVDITKYRTITIGDDDDQQRYGCLRTADMDTEFQIYKVADYVSPKKFKIVSSKPIGTYNPETDELKLNK